MKKRISIILVISVLTIALLASFAGCNAELATDEGMAYLKECIEFNKNANQYHIKTHDIYSPTESLEVKLTVFAEDPENKDSAAKSARITVVTTKDAIASYKSKIWGDSLKTGVKPKKATDADWKKDVMFTSDNGRDYDTSKYTQISFEDFLEDEILKNANVESMVEDLEALVASDVKVTKITRNGKVTDYTYDNIGKDLALEFGFKANDNDVYPLFIECVDGYVAKVSDKVDGGSRIVYFTRQGPNIGVPSWK